MKKRTVILTLEIETTATTKELRQISYIRFGKNSCEAFTIAGKGMNMPSSVGEVKQVQVNVAK